MIIELVILLISFKLILRLTMDLIQLFLFKVIPRLPQIELQLRPFQI